MLKRRLHGKTFWVLIVLLMSLCVSALARSSTDEWTLNPADYRYDMSLYLSLASKDYENLDLYEIGAFVNDECRGVAEKLDLPNGGSCLYMRVRSNVSSGETINFKLRDRQTGSTYELKGDDGTPLAFQADQMVGKPSAPYVLRIYFNVAVSTDGHGSVDFENGTYADGSTLTLNATPYEGYHFDKWSDGDTASPRQLTVTGDIELTALFAPNIYNAVFMIGSEVIATLEVPYGEAVPSPEVPEKEGAIFAGWNDKPVTMPAHDIEVHGDYITNSYNAIFSIDGEIIAALNIPYGAEIVPPTVPEKTGYSFGGWDNLPETMPAGNIEVTGHYEVNSYGLIFSIGEEKIQESLVEYGATIVAPEAPAKEGYIFTGWQNLPETMPAYDLHIYGEYAPITYNAVFIIDGEVISTVQMQAGMPLTAPEAPVKEGHTFSGWQNLPETMPARDIEVTGSYEINTYIATFKIGSEVVAEIPVVYNTAVTAPDAPEKEGYTFTGWQNIPETMPPFDITIEGNYAVNTYNAVFMIDGTVVATIPLEFGAAVAAPDAPAKEGYAFAGWQDVPETMPARDITVNGSYTILSYIARFIIDGNVVQEQTVEYGAAVTAPDAPEKEGYAFTGWQNLPETMPASDIEITGAYKVMAYNVIFKIDDEVVAYVPVDFGAAVPVAEAPVKEGYTFNGWENVPETMPAHDVEVTGSYSINTYKAVFKADGEVVATLDVEYNSPLTAPEAPAKEGYTFTGWQNVPETMPAFDIEVVGTYAVNAYTATFKIGDEVVTQVPVAFGAAVPTPEAPVKEGHTFNGWENVPETMPAADIEINGSYTINTYKAVFKADGEIVATLDVEYNSALTAPEAPAKEGRTFTGWQNVPETMPAFDVEILGTYAVNTYTVTFRIGDEVVAQVPVDFGAAVPSHEAPVKEGHTFTGWENVPETMPAHDIDINGSYTINTYKAVFKADGEIVATLDVEYNSALTAPEAPAKEGRTFTGWQNVPETMPAFDVEILGTYAVNTYTVTFRIGDEIVAQVPVDFGAAVPSHEAPVKEGHTFTGWENVPETMPAHDVDVNGSYTINTYKAVFKADGEVVATLDVEYNSALTAPEAPAKEGYTFTGWQNVPETMPAFDVEILGTYAVNTYTATFKIGDEIVAQVPVDFGAAVPSHEAPVKEGHTFTGWENVPETMPAHDIDINGSYTINTYKAVFKADGEVVATLDVEYNSALTAPEAPAKEGYTFTGWQNVPETMPAFDIEVVGTYAISAYTATFKIGDEVVAQVPVAFGAAVPTPEAPVKEGHTFTGWENVPETMPAADIEITGAYSVNTYKAVFKADGEVVATLDVEYNSALTAPEAPAKEGYTFTGWQNVPETMPAFDIEVVGTYAVNTYTATFKIDDEVVAVLSVEYGAAIVAPGAPAKEGLLFDGWSNLPETMPAHDIEITGTYSEDPNATPVVSTYTATFKIDGEIIAMLPVEEGAAIPAQEAPAKEGHTFAGWQNLPEVMPSHDIEITGSYTVNVYKATFVIDGETIETKDVEYNTAVTAPEAPEKEGYTFTGWQNVPETMPPFDIEIQGSYAVKAYTATFRIGDEVVAASQFDYGAAVVAPAAPDKEGHTFAGWQNVPETMPAADIEIQGSYTVNVYKATFVIDGETIETKDVEYNTAVTAPEAPEKEGYTFTGWQNVPETMPPFDIEIQGSYAVKAYTATFRIGDEVIAALQFDYGAAVVAPAAPDKEGHTFAGWQNVPETMPAADIEIQGSYTVNVYKATFVIDGETIETKDVEYNTAVTAPEAPEKEGYTFTGWQNVPETMPPFDIEIQGSYAVNAYTVTFRIGEEVVATTQFAYGAAVVAPAAPDKEGHTFAGWENVPETMPAADIEISGSYTVNSYKATFVIDGVVVEEKTVEYNAAVTAPEAPAKEGYSFTGWQNVPETMPPFDIEIQGSYAVNAYTATFRIGDEVVAASQFDFGAAVVAPAAPDKEGHTFAGWENVPETMPAADIEISGSYTVNSYKATFVIDGETIETKDVEYNTAVIAPEAPEKEGYTFTGWQNVPETMPPFDIEIQGSYAVHPYTATFKIGDEVIATLQFDYGAAVVAPAAPDKEGHTFAGWENVPETMPAADIEIQGSYTVNVYKATFVIDGETIETKDVEYNTAVTAPEAPEKEGYTFTGWQNVPETMPPFDIEIQGSYTVNAYTATFRIGDDIVAAAQFDYGAAVVAPAAPDKEGHTFAGWENVPETMPAADIEIQGSYTVNVYKASFVIDGELLEEKNFEYDTEIVAPEVPDREGHTFSGWLDMPQTMPPFDVVINGTFNADAYTVTFVIDGEVVATIISVYGSEIVAPVAPEKEGHTFAGWENVPETMPAENIVVTGSYTVNTYKATFIADDVVVAETDVEYNTALPVPDAPEKEGYTFTGWQNVPETMPPFDVNILGTYAVNTYNVTFTADGEIVAVIPCDFGAAITTPEAPAKEGHTFAGWNDVPETMPASDITISGDYTINSYTARYLIGDEVIAEASVEYGAQLPPVTAPERVGESFAGWDNLPAVMPAYNVDIYGSYVKNTYTATFMIGNELIASLRVSYGDAIQEPEAPVKEGHEFAGWQNVPETMPAEDIVINGSYNVCSYMLTVYLNDDLYISELVEYGAPVVIPEPELSDEYEFAGWLEEIPETMPAHEVVIHGVVNKKSSALEELYKDSETITVYNLNGVLLFDQISVSDALKRLAPGFYIVNGTKVRVK